MKFLHERRENGSSNGFWLIDEDNNRVFNIVGGFHEYKPSPNDEIYEVNGWEELPWREYLYCKDSRYGWLEPNGEFFPCASYDHSDVAQFIYNKTEREMEEAGYIKIYNSFFSKKPDFFILKPMTKAQYDKLIEMGFFDKLGTWEEARGYHEYF